MSSTREDNNKGIPSHYEILGVSDDASDTEIRNAYKKLASEWHPDKHRKTEGGYNEANAKFKLIGEAYATLKDPRMRRVYDAQRKFGGDGNEFQTDEENAGAAAAAELFAHAYATTAIRHFADTSPLFRAFSNVARRFAESALGVKEKSSDNKKTSSDNKKESETTTSPPPQQTISFKAPLPSSLNASLSEIATGTRFEVPVSDGKNSAVIIVSPGTVDGTRFSSSTGEVFVLQSYDPEGVFFRDEETPSTIRTDVHITLVESLTGNAKGEINDVFGKKWKWSAEGTVIPSGHEVVIKGAGLPRKDSPSKRGDLILTLSVSKGFPTDPLSVDTVISLLLTPIIEKRTQDKN